MWVLRALSSTLGPGSLLLTPGSPRPSSLGLLPAWVPVHLEFWEGPCTPEKGPRPGSHKGILRAISVSAPNPSLLLSLALHSSPLPVLVPLRAVPHLQPPLLCPGVRSGSPGHLVHMGNAALLPEAVEFTSIPRLEPNPPCSGDWLVTSPHLRPPGSG